MTTVGRFTVWIIAAVLVVIVVYFAGYRVANTLPLCSGWPWVTWVANPRSSGTIIAGVVGLGPALLDTRETNY